MFIPFFPATVWKLKEDLGEKSYLEYCDEFADEKRQTGAK